jgi:hypothetical protein
MPLPAHLLHDLGQSSSVLPLEHCHHLSSLATFARRAGFQRLGGPFALGRVLGGGGLLVALPFVGAPLADCVPPLALRSAFGCAGSATFGFVASPRSWMLFQIRVVAVVRSLNFLTGASLDWTDRHNDLITDTDRRHDRNVDSRL